MHSTTALVSIGFLLTSVPVFAQSWTPPTDAQRCPSKWGAADQRGAGNHMKPETVLRATRLIRTGEVFELGRVLKVRHAVFGRAGASRWKRSART